MYARKTLLTTAILSIVTVMTGCGTTKTIPLEKHEQELSVQKSQYEQQIQQLQNTTNELEAQSQTTTVEVVEVEVEVEVNSSPAKTDVSNQLYPDNAELGHCYSRVLTPATYKSVNTKVLVTPVSEIISIAPAAYANDTEKVLVEKASTKTVVVPATYKTVTERVMVKSAHVHLKVVPATYETVTERVLDKPAYTAWKRGAGFQSSALETRIDNGTGEIMCLVEVPATYKTTTKRVLKTAERTVEDKHDAEYKTVTKRVIDKAATTKIVPASAAQYKTVSVKRLVSAEKVVRKSVPAVYKNVTSSEKVKSEEQKWAEVLCESNMTTTTVSQLQKLLKRAGTYDGPIDGIYGPLTERAANSYAKSNDLPTGTRLISLETAKHIGLSI
jgi:TolA-binding protein